MVKEIKMPGPSMSDVQTLAFIVKNQDQDKLTHIEIPPFHDDTEKNDS